MTFDMTPFLYRANINKILQITFYTLYQYRANINKVLHITFHISFQIFRIIKSYR